ncbi:MAG: hypothetical protein V4580_03440 [Bacteroidota bacterium]
MKKFKYIDQIYNEVKEHMPVEERISYCQKLISETQLFVQQNSSRLEDRERQRYTAILLTAQKEIDKLKAKGKAN